MTLNLVTIAGIPASCQRKVLEMLNSQLDCRIVIPADLERPVDNVLTQMTRNISLTLECENALLFEYREIVLDLSSSDCGGNINTSPGHDEHSSGRDNGKAAVNFARVRIQRATFRETEAEEAFFIGHLPVPSLMDDFIRRVKKTLIAPVKNASEDDVHIKAWVKVVDGTLGDDKARKKYLPFAKVLIKKTIAQEYVKAWESRVKQMKWLCTGNKQEPGFQFTYGKSLKTILDSVEAGKVYTTPVLFINNLDSSVSEETIMAALRASNLVTLPTGGMWKIHKKTSGDGSQDNDTTDVAVRLHPLEDANLIKRREAMKTPALAGLARDGLRISMNFKEAIRYCNFEEGKGFMMSTSNGVSTPSPARMHIHMGRSLTGEAWGSPDSARTANAWSNRGPRTTNDELSKDIAELKRQVAAQQKELQSLKGQVRSLEHTQTQGGQDISEERLQNMVSEAVDKRIGDVELKIAGKLTEICKDAMDMGIQRVKAEFLEESNKFIKKNMEDVSELCAQQVTRLMNAAIQHRNDSESRKQKGDETFVPMNQVKTPMRPTKRGGDMIAQNEDSSPDSASETPWQKQRTRRSPTTQQKEGATMRDFTSTNLYTALDEGDLEDNRDEQRMEEEADEHTKEADGSTTLAGGGPARRK